MHSLMNIKESFKMLAWKIGVIYYIIQFIFDFLTMNLQTCGLLNIVFFFFLTLVAAFFFHPQLVIFFFLSRKTRIHLPLHISFLPPQPKSHQMVTAKNVSFFSTLVSFYLFSYQSELLRSDPNIAVFKNFLMVSSLPEHGLQGSCSDPCLHL